MRERRVVKLYYEWPDGSHVAKKLPVEVGRKTACEFAMAQYDKHEVKPSEIIGWDEDGIAVFGYDFRSGEPVLSFV